MARKIEDTIPQEEVVVENTSVADVDPGDCIIVEHENPDNLPDLIIDVPKEDGSIDISSWAANMRKALGKIWNVKFRIWPVES